MMFAPSRPADDRFWNGDEEDGSAPELLWEQMAEPRYVLAMGACAICGPSRSIPW